MLLLWSWFTFSIMTKITLIIYHLLLLWLLLYFLIFSIKLIFEYIFVITSLSIKLYCTVSWFLILIDSTTLKCFLLSCITLFKIIHLLDIFSTTMIWLKRISRYFSINRLHLNHLGRLIRIMFLMHLLRIVVYRIWLLLIMLERIIISLWIWSQLGRISLRERVRNHQLWL